MWTRATAERVALATMFLEHGHADTARWLLPRKWKIRSTDPMIIRMKRILERQMLAILESSVRLFAHKDLDFIGGERWGSTIEVRKPTRFQ